VAVIISEEFVAEKLASVCSPEAGTWQTKKFTDYDDVEKVLTLWLVTEDKN